MIKPPLDGGSTSPHKGGSSPSKGRCSNPPLDGGSTSPHKGGCSNQTKGKGDNKMDLDVITEKLKRMMESTIVMILKMMPTENAEGLTRTKNQNEHHHGHHVRAAELDRLGGNAGDANFGFVAIIVSTIGSATNHFVLIAHQDRKKEQHRLLHHDR